jgi:hypothetical protein
VAIGVDGLPLLGGQRLLVDLGLAVLVGLAGVVLLRRDIRDVVRSADRRATPTATDELASARIAPPAVS